MRLTPGMMKVLWVYSCLAMALLILSTLMAAKFVEALVLFWTATITQFQGLRCVFLAELQHEVMKHD